MDSFYSKKVFDELETRSLIIIFRCIVQVAILFQPSFLNSICRSFACCFLVAFVDCHLLLLFEEFIFSLMNFLSNVLLQYTFVVSTSSCCERLSLSHLLYVMRQQNLIVLTKFLKTSIFWTWFCFSESILATPSEMDVLLFEWGYLFCRDLPWKWNHFNFVTILNLLNFLLWNALIPSLWFGFPRTQSLQHHSGFKSNLTSRWIKHLSDKPF